MITLVVFSKDRAMQLDSLLRSVKDHCTGIDRVVPIVYASNKLHEDAYWRLANDESMPFTELRVQVGDSLGALLAEKITGSDHVALAVDDQLFYAPSDFKKAAHELDAEDAFVWSWRLGWRKPGAEWDSDTFWYCSALSSDPDYGYLFHSDGALYHTTDYLAKLDRCLPDWRTGDYTPNDLESATAARKKIWAPFTGPHLGPLSPTCITWQVNLARRAYATGSPAFELPETQLDALAKAYLEGKRVDNEKLYGVLNADPLRFNQPGDRPTHVRACEEASKFWASTIR